MSKGHFQPTVARGAQANQVIEKVCLVLKLKIATAFDMVNVKVSSAWAMACAAIVTSLVALHNQESDFLPIPTARKFFAAAPMRAAFSNHVRYGAFPGTEFAAILNFRGERSEFFAAMLTYLDGVFPGGFVLTLARAMANCLVLLMEHLATMKTRNIFHPCASPSKVTIARAKDVCNVFPCAMRLAIKLLSALRAGNCLGFANRVYRASARTMIDCAVIRLKLFVALEANLDHNFC